MPPNSNHESHEYISEIVEKSQGDPGAFTEQSPRRSVGRTLTLMWEHPLVSPELRDFRATSLDNLRTALKDAGLSQQVLLVPAGSILWGINKQSDVDLFGFERDGVEEAVLMRLLNRMPIQGPEYNLCGSNTEENYTQTRFPDWEVLFLTPDDYLVGDLKLAAELRMKVLNDYSGTPEQFDAELQHCFSKFYRGWKDLPYTYGVKDRLIRFNTLVDRRAAQSPHISEYSSKFQKILERFTIPTYAQYVAELASSEGHISLRPLEPRYSQSITTLAPESVTAI